jgi:hypothetical protein
MDAGSRIKVVTVGEAPRYSFSNRSADARRIFCDACDVLGLRWTAAPDTIYISRKADVARMDEFIGPKR